MSFVKKIIGSALLGVCFAGGVFSGEEGSVRDLNLLSGELDINFGSDLSLPTQALPPIVSSAKSSNDEHKEEVEDGIKPEEPVEDGIKPEEPVVENIGGHDDEVAVLEGVDKDKNDANLDLSGQGQEQVSDEVPAQVSEKGQEKVSGQVSAPSSAQVSDEVPAQVSEKGQEKVSGQGLDKEDGGEGATPKLSGVVNASEDLAALKERIDNLQKAVTEHGLGNIADSEQNRFHILNLAKRSTTLIDLADRIILANSAAGRPTDLAAGRLADLAGYRNQLVYLASNCLRLSDLLANRDQLEALLRKKKLNESRRVRLKALLTSCILADRSDQLVKLADSSDQLVKLVKDCYNILKATNFVRNYNEPLEALARCCVDLEALAGRRAQLVTLAGYRAQLVALAGCRDQLVKLARCCGDLEALAGCRAQLVALAGHSVQLEALVRCCDDLEALAGRHGDIIAAADLARDAAANLAHPGYGRKIFNFVKNILTLAVIPLGYIVIKKGLWK
ncbi:MAG: hypothetical protein LBS83_00875 [Holosporales bacterium]|nr:hypothetical protein [Holosporales bacterium]